MSPWTTGMRELRGQGRIDPDFFDPRVQETQSALERAEAVPLAGLVRGAWRGVGPEYVDTPGVRVVKTAHVRRFELLRSPAQYVGEVFAEKNAHALVPDNSLLITSTGVGSAARTCGYLSGDEPLFADNHITIVDVGDSELTAYLAAYLQTPAGIQMLWRTARGSSRQLEIYPLDILRLLVPVPAQAIVSEIASRWLGALEQVHEARDGGAQAEERLLQGLEAPKPAVAGPRVWTTDIQALRRVRRIDPQFTEPDVAAIRAAIQDAGGVSLASLVTSGHKGVQPSGYDPDGQVGVIKSKDVNFPGPNLDAIDRAHDEDFAGARLHGGELLINMTGEGTLGRGTVVPKLPEDLYLVPSVDVYALNLDERVVVPQYVAIFLNTSVGRAITGSLQTGSSGQQHLYPAHFRDIPVPLPRRSSGQVDLEAQREIVALADTQGQAIAVAKEAARDLDERFASWLDVSVDLGTVPR